jgi:sec-independent protein translocase protein TatC
LCFMLVRLNIVGLATLKNIRPYVIVSAFIIGMLLTPPDVFSQIILAVPLCLLYELGIILVLYLL